MLRDGREFPHPLRMPGREIDMAAYVLTDWPIMQALTRAADRGVKVRIYLDGTQLGERAIDKFNVDMFEVFCRAGSAWAGTMKAIAIATAIKVFLISKSPSSS
jgi:hypothetical protein